MKRLLSLDILRGITVAGMILVNNAGGRFAYAPLQHSTWHGLTPCDLVFPFFLFIMGISTYISLNKNGFTPTAKAFRKIIKRTILIACIGWAIFWFDDICNGDFLPFDHLRIPGVLPRIALCYGVVSVIALTGFHKFIPWLAGILLAGYALLLAVGNGYVCDESNILSIVDRKVFGVSHVYTKSVIDPEGLLSSISAIAHTLIGFYCGKVLIGPAETKDKVLKLFLIGFGLLFIGFLISLPINKRIWSPSFVLVTCGLAASLLAMLTYFIDVKEMRQSWQTFFHVFGVNPLFLYVLSEVVAVVFGSFGIKALIYEGMLSVISNPYVSSALYGIAFTLLMGMAGYPLYKRKIYIKL